MFVKAIQRVVGLMMLLSLSNKIFRRAGPACARAFSSEAGAFVRGSRASSTKKSEILPFSYEDSRNRCYSTTTNLHAGVVEQDLDSALDDLLQGTFDASEDIDDVQTEDFSKSASNENVSIRAVYTMYSYHGVMGLILYDHISIKFQTHQASF